MWRAAGAGERGRAAFAGTLRDELCARGAFASLHLHDRFSGREPFRFHAHVAIKRHVVDSSLERVPPTGIARLRCEDQLRDPLQSRVLALRHADFYSR